MNLPKRQQLFLAAKVAVFFLMLWLIAKRIFFQGDLENQFNYFKQNIRHDNYWLLVLAVLLMPFNWLLETVKWKWLINVHDTFFNLFKSVLAGIALGFVTPARSGEFIGRVLYVNEEDKAKVFYLSTIGGIAQTTITLLVGVYCVLQWSSESFWAGLVCGAAVSSLLFYYRFDLFNSILSSISFLRQNNLVVSNHDLPSPALLTRVLLISSVRYAVYLMQYVLAFLFFGAGENVFGLVVHSGVFLVLQTISPLMPFLDFSFRGGTALYVFANYSDNNLGVLTAVTFVWLLNLVCPALLGYFFILRKKF